MATLKVIAEACGLSPQTVSKILNGKQASLYRKETRELVRKVANEMGYRANASAQAMRNGKFKSVMLLRSPDPYYSTLPHEALYSIQNTLAGLDYNLVLNVLPWELEKAEAEIARMLHKNFVDGMLVSINKAFPEWLEDLLEKACVPIVWIGSKHEKNCVLHDDFGAAGDITRRLLALGHRKISYIDHQSPFSHEATLHFSVKDRMNGYLKAMAEAGCEPHVVRPSEPIPHQQVVKYTEENLIKHRRPTAVVAYDMNSGRSVLYAFGRNGIAIPDDVSFVTFTPPATVENDLDLACFVPSPKNVGKISVELLVNRIHHRSADFEPTILPFEFLEGETIAEPQQEA